MMTTRTRYHLPNLLTSSEDLDRFHHRDLRGLTDAELLALEIATKSAYAGYSGTRARIPVPHPGASVLASAWLLTSMRAIRAEADRRRGSAR